MDPLVLDISSDEEPSLVEGPESFDYDWIKQLLGDSDNKSDDSDDVIVVREVKPGLKSKSSKPSVKDADDDCVVLDGDPENRVTSVNEEATESDELLIVGEKGQIACRDYPHPRHLCAKFPFASTPHERHCDQCHCYVCDLLAPCLKWSTGISSTDHCHATDKAEIWKIQRKNFKLGKSASFPASSNDTLTSLTHPRRSQVMPLGINRLSENSILQTRAPGASAVHTRFSFNPSRESQISGPTILRACSSSLDSTVENEVLRPSAIRVCSSTTSFTVPSGTIHGRCQESGSTLARNRYQSGQLLGVRNNTIRRDRRHIVASLRPRLNRSCMISKEVGNVGATLTVNDSAYDSSGQSDHVNPAQQDDRYHATTGLYNDRNDNMWNDVWPITNLSSYPHPNFAQPSLNYVGGNTMTSESQVFNQPLTESNIYQSSTLVNEVLSFVACLDSNQQGNEHQNVCQNENASENTIHCENPNPDTFQQQHREGNQSENICQSSILVNEVPSFVACLNGNELGNEHQNVCQNEDASENTIHCENPNPDTFQQQHDEGNQSETARKEDSSVFDASSIEPLTGSSHLQSSVSMNQSPVMKEADVQSAGNTNLNVLDIEKWLFDQDSVPGVADAEAAFPSFLDIPSPDLSPINTGMLLF